eukprot:gene12837-42540_t
MSSAAAVSLMLITAAHVAADGTDPGRAASADYAYADYLRDFAKPHGGKQAERAFHDNMRTIRAHNARNESWRMG